MSRSVGLVDMPGGRKAHAGAVPLVGGIAMFLALVFGLLLLPTPLGPMRAWLAGATLLLVVGLLDDLHELSSNARFAAQIVAGLFMVYWGDVRLGDFGHLLQAGELTQLGWWSAPLTVFAVVGVINAVNMIDGLDGLAGGLSLIAVLGLALVAGQSTLPVQALLTLLAVILAGFLVFNLPLPWRDQARVFMGDAGSMFLGYTLAWCLVAVSQGEQRGLAPSAALWLLALPLIDTVSLMLRRALKGRSPFSADREHLHHLLLAMGMSPRRVTVVLLIVGAALAALGWGAASLGLAEHLLFYGFLLLFAVHFWVTRRAWARGRIWGRALRTTPDVGVARTSA